MSDQQKVFDNVEGSRSYVVSGCSDRDLENFCGIVESDHCDIFTKRASMKQRRVGEQSLEILIILLSVLFFNGATQVVQGINYPYIDPLQQSFVNPPYVTDMTSYNPLPAQSDYNPISQMQLNPQVQAVSPNIDDSQLQLQNSILSALKDLLNRCEALNIPDCTKTTKVEPTAVQTEEHILPLAPVDMSFVTNPSSNMALVSLEELDRLITNIQQLASVQATSVLHPEITLNESEKSEKEYDDDFELIKAELTQLKVKLDILLQKQSDAVNKTATSSSETLQLPASIPDLNTKEGCKRMFPNQEVCNSLPSLSTVSLSIDNATLEYISFDNRTYNIPPCSQPSTMQIPVPSYVTQLPYQPIGAYSPVQPVTIPPPTPIVIAPPTAQPVKLSLTAQPVAVSPPTQPVTVLPSSQSVIVPPPTQPVIVPPPAQPVIVPPPTQPLPLSSPAQSVTVPPPEQPVTVSPIDQPVIFSTPAQPVTVPSPQQQFTVSPPPQPESVSPPPQPESVSPPPQPESVSPPPQPESVSPPPQPDTVPPPPQPVIVPTPKQSVTVHLPVQRVTMHPQPKPVTKQHPGKTTIQLSSVKASKVGDKGLTIQKGATIPNPKILRSAKPTSKSHVKLQPVHPPPSSRRRLASDSVRWN